MDINIKKYTANYAAYVKNAGLYLAASLFASLLSVLANPLLAMNLSGEDYAIIGYYQGLANFFLPFIGFFILDFYLRKYYTLDEDKRSVLRSTILHLYLFFSLAVTLLCLMGLFIYITVGTSSFPFFPYGPLMLFQLYFSFLLTFLMAEYRIQGKASKFARITIISGVVSVSFSLLFVVVFKGGALGKMIATFIATVLMFFYSIHYYRDAIKIKPDYSFLRELFPFAIPLVLAGVLGFFTNGYDRVYLERGKDLMALGLYSIGFQMASYLSIFADSVKATFQPDVFKSIAQKDLKKIIKINLMIILVISVIVLLFYLFCPFIVRILTAGRYVSSTPFARILSLSIITSNFYYLISQATFALGLSNLNLINKIIGAALTIGLFAIIIPRYGAYGAAWGVVISFLFSGITNLFLLYLNRKKILI